MPFNVSFRWLSASRSKAARRRRHNAVDSVLHQTERLEVRRLLAATGVANKEEVPAPTAVPQELLIQFEAGANAATRANVRGNLGAKVVERIDTPAMRAAAAGVMELVKLPPGLSISQAITRLKNNPNVRFAEPNWVLQHQAVSNDPYYTGSTGQRLWGMYSDDPQNLVGPSGTHNPFGSQAEKAWNTDEVGSRKVYVGIIDQGVDYRHPDLYENIAINQAEIPSAIRSVLVDVDGDEIISFVDLNDSRNQGAGKITDRNANSRIDGGDLLVASGSGGWANGNDADGNGRVDDLVGWDFFQNNNTTYDGTGDYHGTHVAGTIGAVGGNGAGVAGMNWEVSMIPVKFLGPDGGTLAAAISSIDYLTNLKRTQGYNIVAMNASWGGGGFSQGMLEAVGRAANEDILFIAAAGNGGADQIGDNNDTVPSYPANLDPTTLASSNPNRSSYNNVVSVAAINSSGGLAGFSNFGATTVHLGAPGVGVISTFPNGGYASLDGTSMAAPHVAGAVALYAAANPGTSAESIRSEILNNVVPTSSLNNRTITDGRLNVDFTSPTAPPSVAINDVSVTEGNSGTKNVTFTVTLSKAGTSSITVNYTSANGTATAGSDYTATSGSVTFAVGETSKTITVPLLGDASAEPDETFFVNLSLAAGAGAVLGDAQGRATIVNDDEAPAPPTVAINDVSIAEGNSGTKNVTFTVTLSKAGTSSITVNYATANGTATAGSDYTATTGSVTFAAGETSKTITVAILGDTAIEPNETLFVNLTLPAGTNAVLGDAQGRATITNDDVAPPSVAINDVSITEGNSGTKNVTFTVTLSKAGASSITVNYATANGTASAGSDYTATSGSVTFAAGETNKTITVPITGDALAEPNETFVVNLTLPPGTTAVLGDAQGRATIVNDDASGTSNDIYVADMTWATGFNWSEGLWTDVTIHVRRDADGDGIGGRADAGDQGVPGATVTLLLIHDSNLNEIYGDSGDPRWQGSATTLANGTVTFTLANSPYLGGFRAEVTALSHSTNTAYTWNADLDGENPDLWARGLGELSQNGDSESGAASQSRSQGRRMRPRNDTTLLAPVTDDDRPAVGAGDDELDLDEPFATVPDDDRNANDELREALSSELADTALVSL